MFASAVWSCVLPRVSEAVEAFVLMHAAAVGCSRARRKAILYTHTFLSLFGPSAGKTRRHTLGDAGRGETAARLDAGDVRRLFGI